MTSKKIKLNGDIIIKERKTTTPIGRISRASKEWVVGINTTPTPITVIREPNR
jgi:hypothetical protein